MRLSTRGRYAVMAMVELAARELGCVSPPEIGPIQQLAATAGRPAGRQQVSLAEIAQAQRLSLAYLEQLFGPLRRAGLVASVRGPGGGYRLGRAAEAISIAAIVEAVDEPLQATRCDDGGPGCMGGERCLTHDLWAELGAQIHLFLDGLNLADVVAGRVLGRAVAPCQQVARDRA